jgi:acyl-CoA thioesterase
MQVSLAEDRTSDIHVAPSPAPSFMPPEQCVALPNAPGLTPEFTRHFDICWAQGSLPFCASPESAIGGWTRFKQDDTGADNASPASIEHILALIDVWPPAVLPMFKKPAPISSLSWTVEVIADINAPDLPGASNCWQYRATTDVADHGFAYIGAELRNNNGALVALSRQTVMVFA